MPPKAILQMSPCCPAQQRAQSHWHVKKKGPACPPGSARERGDTSFVDGLRNVATGSAKPVQRIRAAFAKEKRGFFSPLQMPRLSFHTHAGAGSGTTRFAPPHRCPKDIFPEGKAGLRSPAPLLAPHSDPGAAPSAGSLRGSGGGTAQQSRV